jgi:D-amino-acid dehydrogenase
MENDRSDVLVIGAGVIGLSCAYELSKRGVRVTVIDQGQPGLGCSYGNAGWMTPCFGLPLPMPGMLLKSLKWLIDPVSPLYIKPEPSLMLLKWLLRFLSCMNTQTANRSIASLTEISKYSLTEYAKLEAEIGASFGFTQKGLLMVSQTKEGVSVAVDEMKHVAVHGIPGKEMSAEEIKILEPSLVGSLQGGVYFPSEAHGEPYEVVKALAQGATQNGVKIFPGTEVFDFKMSGNEIQGVRTTRGWFHAKQVVLATGSWSPWLAKKLRLNVPVLGGKGYALIVKPFNPKPQIPMMIIEKKIAVTPRRDSVRLAGTLELVNQDFSINTRRVDAILKGSQVVFNLPADPEIIELWRGLRPCTPDGVPIIGYSKQFTNLFISTGHQMLGLQSAPGSARLAADLLTGATPIFDPKPFRASRF